MMFMQVGTVQPGTSSRSSMFDQPEQRNVDCRLGRRASRQAVCLCWMRGRVEEGGQAVPRQEAEWEREKYESVELSKWWTEGQVADLG